MAMLKRIMLKGFKSIREMDLELRSLNVLIGANGAGKSNLISFFGMLREMTTASGCMQSFVMSSGGAQSLLYYGPRVTPQIEARLEFEVADDPAWRYTYQFILSHVAGDSPTWGDKLVFAEETISLHDNPAEEPKILSLGGGHEESRLIELYWSGHPMAIAVFELLKGCRLYHFHDTRIPKGIQSDIDLLCCELWSDGSNLGSFLYHLKNQPSSVAYQRIVRTIRLIAPFFQDFVLEPSGHDGKSFELDWRDKDSGQVLEPQQLSDGTLRAMCLITLLLQPERELPGLIIVDEPELGLHPYALNLVASLFKSASHHAQVLVSTQSSPFLDQFEPEDVIILDREGRESVFHRADPAVLESWLEEYSLGEVWEKNIIGGRPH